MSMFDPSTFLDATTDTDFETKRREVPEGDYPGVCHKVMVNPVQTKNGERYQLVLTWVVDDEDARMATGQEQPKVMQRVWLDLDENGGLKSGPNANVALGRIRAATGQNKAGKKWSPRNLEGAGALVHVSTRTVNEDKEGNTLDEPMVFTEVSRIAKL